MMPTDGLRSTMFEWDMQLFYVEFEVRSAEVLNPRFFKPHAQQLSVFKEGTTSNGNIVLEKFPMDSIQWIPFYDPDLTRVFLAKMIPKAVTRRIDP